MKHILIFVVIVVTAFALGAGINSLTQPRAFLHLAPSQFNTELNSGKYKLLDIRTAEEYQSGHLKNSSQIDYYQTQKFADYLDSLDKNGKYLIYCRTGHRSGLALGIMKQKGFANVSDLAGGYAAWTTSGLPSE